MDLPINTGFSRGRSSVGGRGILDFNDHLDFPTFPSSSMTGFGVGGMSERMDRKMKEMEQQMSAMRLGANVNRSDFFKRPMGNMNLGMPAFGGGGFGPAGQLSLGSQGGAPAIASMGLGDEHIVEENGVKKFKLEYAIGNFDPDEISVKTEGHTLRVQALRDKNEGGHKEHKEFKRDCTIPAMIDPEAITSHLTPEGVLVLEAPVPLPAIEDKRASTSMSGSSGGASDEDQLSLRSASPSTSTVSSASASRPKFGRQNSAVIEEEDGGRKIKLEFNLEGFRPEDLSLRVTPENTLKIEAVHEEVRGGSTSKKEFRREIGLPESADASNMKSVMTAEGILTVDIPVPTPDYQALPSISGKFEAGTAQPPPALAQAAAFMDSAAVANQLQTTVNNDAVSVDKEHGIQKVKFNVENFAPEEIDLKVVDNILRVHAVHKTSSDGSSVHKEYSRQFMLPEGIDLEALKSTLNEDGVLTVEVPLAPQKPKERKIQIKLS